MTSKFSIDNRELLQRISSGEAVVGIDFGNLIVRELAAFRLAAMDSEPVGMFRKSAVGYTPSYHEDAVPLYRHAQQPVVPENCVTAEHRRVIEMLLSVCGAAFELADDSCQQDVDGEDCHVVPDDAFQKLSDALDEIENTLPTEDIDRPDVFLAWSAMPRAALKSLLQAGNSPAIQDGYVMVPREPTDEMIAAAMNCEDVLFNSDDSFCVQFWNIYEAMLAASPQSPGSEPATVPSKWIPVSERMPEIGDIVLTAMGGVVNVGETECSAANCRFFTSVISGRELPATHWMPLPAGPQEVKP